MEARLHYWKFLATVKFEDGMIYTLNENINILNYIWAFCWFLMFLWKIVACCESPNPLWPQGTEMISMFAILMTSNIPQLHCRVISLWQQIVKTPDLFCTSLSPSMCIGFMHSHSSGLTTYIVHYKCTRIATQFLDQSQLTSGHLRRRQTLTTKDQVKTCRETKIIFF